MTDLQALATEIHQNAIDHGFWPDDRSTGEVLALLHSDLSEALEEHRAGRPAEWFQIDGLRVYPVTDGSGADWTADPLGTTSFPRTWTGVKAKPEGIAVELADCAIRALDFLGYLNWPWWQIERMPEPMSPSGSFADEICRIHHLIDFAYAFALVADGTGVGRALLAIIKECRALAESEGCTDWDGVIARKIAYNQTRPAKHGKAY